MNEKEIARNVWSITLEEMTKTMGSISFVKYHEPYKPKGFEEIYEMATGRKPNKAEGKG